MGASGGAGTYEQQFRELQEGCEELMLKVRAQPLDMRSGVDTALARVVSVFGAARSHHACLFLDRRANRLKVLVHGGFGLWLCARRLQQGHFVRPDTHLGSRVEQC